MENKEVEVLDGNISIDSEHFPDEKFRNYLKENFDKDGNGKLSVDEIKNITYINIANKDISSIEGIQYLTELYLLICSNTKINSIDVSNNLKLRSLYCANNGIESLDVSNNTELVILNCSGNNIRELDLQNCKRLNAIWCDDIAIENSDLSYNKKIESFHINVTLDKKNSYDLSHLKWLEYDKIKNFSFYYGYINETQKDVRSHLSGNKINIIKHNLIQYPFGVCVLDCDDYKIYLNYNLQFKDNIADEPLSKSDINPQILVDIADKDHYVAGISTSCSNVYEQRFEYLWIAKDTKGFITKISDWGKNKWIDWKPNKFGNYTILAKIRVDGRADCIYTAESKYEYHPFIKCECQMPYSQVEPGQPGYLIGIESYENPNQSYQYEMQILNCTLLKQGLPAWTYTTGKFTVPEGNVGWCVWNPDYGYYWTLFRIYDGAGNLIDEYCYPFVNAY